MLFASYACQSGHWNTGNCVSAAGATFDHPITANIYALTDLTTPIATVTQTVTFQYRPSADSTRCGTTGQWFNTIGIRCQYSIGKVITFNFAGETLPTNVVWTVAFDTSTAGYHPLGTATTCFTSPGGCPYDSLNVGSTSFPGAPYSGRDLSDDTAYLSSGSSTAPLEASSGWASFRPLGAITTF